MTAPIAEALAMLLSAPPGALLSGALLSEALLPFASEAQAMMLLLSDLVTVLVCHVTPFYSSTADQKLHSLPLKVASQAAPSAASDCSCLNLIGIMKEFSVLSAATSSEMSYFFPEAPVHPVPSIC